MEKYYKQNQITVDGKDDWIVTTKTKLFEQESRLTEDFFEQYLKLNSWIEITKTEYDKIILNREVISKADKGQLIDDIAIWHNVFSETLIKIMLWLPVTELAQKQRLKLTSDIIAKYNLDLVIKDFKPDYVIPERDKGVLVTGLIEIEKYNAGIYQRLAQAVGLEANALHNEVIDKYEEIINTIHPKQAIDGNTLASELPVNAGGTQNTNGK